MKTAVYFCNCGQNIAGKINAEAVRESLSARSDLGTFKTVDFLCSEAGIRQLESEVSADKPDRVVIAACSPRDHEGTFRQALERSSLNPYLMQMVNIREQIAWVTEKGDKATEKAATAIWAAMDRVALHEPLQRTSVAMCADVAVIGAGPAGLKAAATLAEAGRRVVLIEKLPVIGGLPVRFEELFPDMECGSCMLEPVLGEILHGRYSSNIELLPMSQVIGVTGYCGNYTLAIRQEPRFVDSVQCIGCGECVNACPKSAPNVFNGGLGERKAIDFAFTGGLPNVPFIDMKYCVRSSGETCTLCADACPVGPDVIRFDDTARGMERAVGAVVLSIGAAQFDCALIPDLAYGRIDDVYSSYDFERILSSTGPTGGTLLTKKGKSPAAVAVIYCVGSLDPKHRRYCSGVCCQTAFKFNHMIRSKLPEAEVYHFYREFVMPGKREFRAYQSTVEDGKSHQFRYRNIGDLSVFVCEDGSKNLIDSFEFKSVNVDIIVLCPAVVPAADSGKLSALFDVVLDEEGFFDELHNKLDAARSKVKGVYIAGSCQAPMDIQKSALEGASAAGFILSELAEGRLLDVDPATAYVDDSACAGCRVCIGVCPFRAIRFNAETGKAEVTGLLCHGCGTCVAACPSGAMKARHFGARLIEAEIAGLLR